MCGVATTCGSSVSALSVGGSVSNTSRPAPAIVPASIAVGQRRLVDQLAARGVDDADAVGLHLASRSALNRCRVSGVAGMCRLM